MAFVHLHNHTEYSLLDGATHIYDMVKRAADLGMPAVAITDHGVMSGVPELADACEKVKQIDDILLMNKKGGEGCVREFAEKIIDFLKKE